ncbi:SDR family oxidoreductase [Roseomonas chloroacetimidivorans]|uniref:SDR family oxidoreductase n=1 Tax=Roseomonas chloroacetimidivorans TaxID=1766656 RepID=UPI003C78A513
MHEGATPAHRQQVVLVTGAADDLRWATARRFVGGGWSVALHGLRVGLPRYPCECRPPGTRGHGARAQAGGLCPVDLGRLARRTPLGWLGHPKELAGAIWFLASPQVSYVIGGVLSVDDDRQAFADAGDASDGQG